MTRQDSTHPAPDEPNRPEDALRRKPPSGRPAPRSSPASWGAGVDRGRIPERLIQRCLDGEEQAWEELYNAYHPRLLEAIEFLLGPEAGRSHLLDEIAARVWYALVRDDARLLARFDVERSCRLEAFLMGLARMEIMRYLRAERRRRSHEAAGGRRVIEKERIPEGQLAAMLCEFEASLSQGERNFMQNFLMAGPGEEGAEFEALSQTSIWQRRHRIRFKLSEFFKNQ